MYNISLQVVVQWYFISVKRQSRQTDRNMSLNRSLSGGGSSNLGHSPSPAEAHLGLLVCRVRRERQHEITLLVRASKGGGAERRED